MTYAIQKDITDLYGDDALRVADRDGDGIEEAAAINAALASATAEIDGYIAVRYDLPLAVTPPQLIRPCVDIALYHLVRDAGARTDEDRARYEDAVAFLRRIAKGEAELVLPKSEDPEDAAFEAATPIVQTGPPRIFGRRQTEGV